MKAASQPPNLMEPHLVQVIAIYAIPVILAITLHEAAHGYVAMRFGDITAYAAGRVSLNPLRHIDPVGTVALPLALLAIGKLVGGGSMLFGWAKPVPVNFSNLRDPKRNMLWVAAAGPFSNLLMALAWLLLLKMAVGFPTTSMAGTLAFMAAAGVFVNVIFFMLNLLPLPPLDGGRMLVSVLPARIGGIVARCERFGLAVLILLLFTGGLRDILWPLLDAALRVFAQAIDLPAGELLRLVQLR